LKAEVKAVFSPDLDRDELPDDPENASVYIVADIGIEGEVGADMFTFYAQTRGCPVVKGSLCLDRFDWDTVENEIRRIASEAKGYQCWEDIARHIGKYGLWEYEGMEPLR
jgi:hypothetical protein